MNNLGSCRLELLLVVSGEEGRVLVSFWVPSAFPISVLLSLVLVVAESRCVYHQAPQHLYQAEPKPPCVPPPPLPRLVREFVAQNNTSQIKHVIQILSQEFALSQHPHSRKGGLIGLAACSIALGKVGMMGILACAGCGERTAAPLGSL